jgi:hypothetical protein
VDRLPGCDLRHDGRAAMAERLVGRLVGCGGVRGSDREDIEGQGVGRGRALGRSEREGGGSE